jgi:hypothetical protein
MQDEMTDHIDFLEKTNKETLYFHQEMKAPDRDEFVKAIVKEMNYIVNKDWELVPRQDVPPGIKVLDSCSMGYETQEIHTYSQSAEVEGQAKHARGAT